MPKPTNWMEAEANCNQLGGYLASVSSAFLNSEVVDFIKGEVSNATSFWIGQTTLLTRSSWSWGDGNSAAYQNWATGKIP